MGCYNTRETPCILYCMLLEVILELSSPDAALLVTSGAGRKNLLHSILVLILVPNGMHPLYICIASVINAYMYTETEAIFLNSFADPVIF